MFNRINMAKIPDLKEHLRFFIIFAPPMLFLAGKCYYGSRITIIGFPYLPFLIRRKKKMVIVISHPEEKTRT